MDGKRSSPDQSQSVPCEEGCGCQISPGHGFLAVIDGSAHHFCCADCADSYQENLQTETATVIQERVGPGMHVADVGCGSGFYTARLAGRVGPDGHVFAIDLEAKNVHRTEEYLTRCGLRNQVAVWVAPAEDLTPIPNGELDFLLSNDVLCCTSDRAGAFREIARVLRSGAVAYVRVSEAAPKDARPVSTREWERGIALFERLADGQERGTRWVLLRNRSVNGR
jgi:SAM-dependent methyltransferase